jgi:S-adenosylmethionine-diacylglycerol 3-amino-3-carboxypropyl transferase
MNPRQNALLDLKIAAIKNLAYEDFYWMFGRGYLPKAKEIYKQKLRGSLPNWSRNYWDTFIKFFCNKDRPFYFRGTSGVFARAVKFYTDRVIGVRTYIDAILEAKTLEEQRSIYFNHLRAKFWSRPMKFAMNRDSTLSLVGVPKAQRRQVESQYPGGIVKFVQDCVEAVFADLPLSDNYFWRVYMTGRYSRDCCPEYLKPDNFEALKNGLVDRVSTHTDSVQGFLDKTESQISRYVLLDHMDWLSDKFFPLLELEWQAILKRAAPQTKLIWRSGGMNTDFLDRVQVSTNGDGKLRQVVEMLKLDKKLAAELHPKDRVHTYGSFYIAELVR